MMPALHAKIGPSSLKRTMNCPGSVRENEKLPNNSNDAADEGSCLHAFCEEVLLSEGLLDPHDFVGKTYVHNGYQLTITNELADLIVPSIDWIREQPGELLIEQRVFLDPWLPGQFGTCDVAILTDELCIVYDWKFGVGVPVKVADNVQLMAYALGFLHTILRPRGVEPPRFRLIIEQPRNSKGGRYWEPWDISLEELLAFGEALKATYTKVMDPNAPCIAGDWCRETFCGVLDRPGGCPAFDSWMLGMISAKFDALDDEAPPEMPDTYSISPTTRWQIVRHANHIRWWLAKLHEDSMSAYLAGNPDPGSKLVAGQKGDRYFTDPEAAELIAYAALGDQAFTSKLKGIAQLEKVLKPGRKRAGNPLALKYLNELVDQDEGKPILVPESDPKPALKTVDNVFDDDDDL